MVVEKPKAVVCVLYDPVPREKNGAISKLEVGNVHHKGIGGPGQGDDLSSSTKSPPVVEAPFSVNVFQEARIWEAYEREAPSNARVRDIVFFIKEII